jgi:CRP-like cAMP-binding protein
VAIEAIATMGRLNKQSRARRTTLLTWARALKTAPVARSEEEKQAILSWAERSRLPFWLALPAKEVGRALAAAVEYVRLEPGAVAIAPAAISGVGATASTASQQLQRGRSAPGVGDKPRARGSLLSRLRAAQSAPTRGPVSIAVELQNGEAFAMVASGSVECEELQAPSGIGDDEAHHTAPSLHARHGSHAGKRRHAEPEKKSSPQDAAESAIAARAALTRRTSVAYGQASAAAAAAAADASRGLNMTLKTADNGSSARAGVDGETGSSAAAVKRKRVLRPGEAFGARSLLTPNPAFLAVAAARASGDGPAELAVVRYAAFQDLLRSYLRAKIAFFASVYPFAMWPEDKNLRFSYGLQQIRIPARAVVYRYGDVPDGVYFVTEGECALLSTPAQTRDRLAASKQIDLRAAKATAASPRFASSHQPRANLHSRKAQSRSPRGRIGSRASASSVAGGHAGGGVDDGASVHIDIESGRTYMDHVGYQCFNYYRFELRVPNRLLRVKLEVAEGDPDLYICNRNPAPNRERYTWRSAGEGADEIWIPPSDPGFALGPYFVGVYGAQSCEFTIRVDEFNPPGPSIGALPRDVFAVVSLGPGHFFGEEEALVAAPREFTVVAASPCTMLVSSAKHFLAHVRGPVLNRIRSMAARKRERRARHIARQATFWQEQARVEAQFAPPHELLDHSTLEALRVEREFNHPALVVRRTAPHPARDDLDAVHRRRRLDEFEPRRHRQTLDDLVLYQRLRLFGVPPRRPIDVADRLRDVRSEARRRAAEGEEERRAIEAKRARAARDRQEQERFELLCAERGEELRRTFPLVRLDEKDEDAQSECKEAASEAKVAPPSDVGARVFITEVPEKAPLQPDRKLEPVRQSVPDERGRALSSSHSAPLLSEAPAGMRELLARRLEEGRVPPEALSESLVDLLATRSLRTPLFSRRARSFYTAPQHLVDRVRAIKAERWRRQRLTPLLLEDVGAAPSLLTDGNPFLDGFIWRHELGFEEERFANPLPDLQLQRELLEAEERLHLAKPILSHECKDQIAELLRSVSHAERAARAKGGRGKVAAALRRASVASLELVLAASESAPAAEEEEEEKEEKEEEEDEAAELGAASLTASENAGIRSVAECDRAVLSCWRALQRRGSGLVDKSFSGARAHRALHRSASEKLVALKQLERRASTVSGSPPAPHAHAASAAVLPRVRARGRSLPLPLDRHKSPPPRIGTATGGGSSQQLPSDPRRLESAYRAMLERLGRE